MKCSLLLAGFVASIALAWAQPQKIAHQMDTFASLEECEKALSQSRQGIQEAAIEQTEGLVEQMNEAIIEEGLDFNLALRVESISCELAAKDELGAVAAPATVAAGFVLFPVALAVATPVLIVGMVGIDLYALNMVLKKASSEKRSGILHRLQNATEKALEIVTEKFKKIDESGKKRLDRLANATKAVTGFTITVHFAVEQN